MINEKVENPGEIKENINQPSANKEVVEKTIANHKQAARHHMEAAKHHMEAARHHEEGNHEKAAHSTLLAYGHHTIAGEFVSDDAKHHAQTLKQINYQ